MGERGAVSLNYFFSQGMLFVGVLKSQMLNLRLFGMLSFHQCNKSCESLALTVTGGKLEKRP